MQRRLPKPFTLLLFFFLLSNYLSATPECPIISGKFELADGTTSDPSATGWYLDASKVASTGIFAVKSKRVHAQELGGEGIWYSRVFSTAGYSDFQVAVKVTAEGDMNSSEYVKIYYKINGGAETLLDSRTGNFGTIDFTSGTLTGSNVQLVVKIYNYNNGGSQTSKYYIEEYRVFKEKGPCAVSAITATATAANGGILTCSNPSLGLSATATGSGTTTWNWSGPNGFTSTAQNPTVTAAGTYTVVATNSSGTGSASVAVTENKTAPVVTATGGALACGSCVTISATSNVSGASYSWSGPNNFSSTSQNPTVCAAGTYTVTVTNPANGCSAQQSVSVTAGSSAVSTFWLEDFAGLSNGTTSDAGSTAWTTSVTGSGTYSVQNNEFKTSFSGSQGVGIWTSQSIDISSKTNVSFSVDLRSEVASSSDQLETADYIRVYYKLNGGAETLAFEDLAGLGSTTNTNASATFNSASLNGSTLQIIIKTSNSDPTERYYFDNIKVTGTSASTGTVTVTPSVNGTVTCTATAQLSATASSSVSSWAWTGPNGFTSSVQNPAVSSGGQYVVTATLASGCAASATITVPENKTAPDITATGGNLACLSSITLNVSSTVSGATYRWTGPNSFTSTSKNPSVSAVGTYTATVTNPANGCTASQSVSVTAGSSAAATFWLEDFSDISNGATSDAGATAWTSTASGSGINSVQSNEFKTSFDDQYEGVWTSQAISIAGKSNVTFSVDLRSEVTSGSFETADYIRVYYKLNGGAETLVFEDLAGLGSTTTGTASTTFTSAALNGSTLQVIIKTSNSGSAERYYFDNIKLTGSNVATESVTATGGTITCATSSATLLGSSTAGGVSYSWTGPNNFISTAQNPVVTASGIYTLTIQNPATGCSGTDTALVALNTTAPGATASASGTLSCGGGSSVTLSGGSSTTGVTYRWTGPNNFTSTAQNPAVTTAGTYTLTVTNPANGCTSTASAIVSVATSSAAATFWLEDFSDISNGATSDAGATAWTSTASGSGINSVQNNEFKTSFDDQYEGVWTSQVINIAGKSNVTFSVDLRSEVTSGSFETADYIRVYYKLNGGAETLAFEDLAGLGSTTTGTASTTFTSAALNGSTLQVIIKTSNSGSAERYYFDNIKLTGSSSSSENATATGGAITCTTSSVTLLGSSTAGGVNYSWTGPNNFASTAQNPVVTASGIYTLTIQNPATGCSGTDTALVALNTTAPGATASAIGTLGCGGGSSVALSGGSSTTGVTYNWTGPNNFTSTTQNPGVTSTGTYKLTVTNPVNGCTSTASAIVTASNTTTSTWLEDFTLADGTTTDAGATPWTTSVNPSTALFSVLNNEFRVSNSSTNTGAEGVWTSGAINITGKTTATISAGVRSSIINGAVMNTDPVYGDYIRFYYKLNNGTEVLFAEKTAAINNHSTTPTPVSISLSGLNASTLQIVVRAKATGNDEFYYFDNIQAVATGPSLLNAVATATDILTCTKNSVGLTGSSSATSAINYSWTGPGTFTSAVQNPSATTAGIYTLTVTDPSTGCTGSDTALVSINNTAPGATAAASGTLTCTSSSTSLTGSSSTSGVTYNWTGPNSFTSTTQNPAVTAVGTYNLTVTNPANGCTSTASATVTKSPNNITASATGGVMNCINNSVTLQGSTAASGASYTWGGPNGYTSSAQNPVVTATGAYTLTVTVGSCTATATATVTKDTIRPAINATANPIKLTCVATPATLTGSSTTSGVSYSWSNGVGVIATTAVTSVTIPGTYVLTVTNPANGCLSTSQVTVTQDIDTPTGVTASHTGIITCNNPSIAISATISSPSLTYKWSGPNGYTATTLNASINKGGTYIITATNPTNGCFATASTIVEENTAPPGEISINNSGIITCLNTSITISGFSSSTGVSYVWQGPGGYTTNSSSANVSHGGLYTLIATNPGNGCKSNKSTNVVENTTAPAFTISNTSPITCINPSATLTANTTNSGAQFMWVGPDFVSVEATATVFTSGIYYITVTDPSNGCFATDFAEVTEDYSHCARKATTGTATKTTAQNTPASVVTSFTYKAYPNPVATSGVIEFTSPQSANTSVSLYNALGTSEKVLFRGVITANRQYQVAIPATQLPAGAYYYIINTGEKTYTGKLMIVK